MYLDTITLYRLLGDTVNKFSCRSDDSQNLFPDLSLKSILQIQGIWDKEWHDGVICKSDLFTVQLIFGHKWEK